ncbi:hypothetical protein ANSO36C_24860 [Nostoc cf. commune SO-36]|uniref:DUF2752 domain-containing protein n=1 Tax=Nostoc cf. commune SO-36 TaxID=449208 RepID=A0ABM7Z129_NOSCO|nr:hypothetical protein ANSO36C_24860 [Nostoc cf. commune SO-36]
MVFQLSPYPLSSHGKLVRWGLLGFSCTPLIGTYFYHQGYRIGFLVCPIRHLTGIPCPTCGMTRSFIAIAQGDLVQAVAENLFGPVLFASFVIVAIHIALELLTKRRITAFYSHLVKQRKLQIIGLFSVLTYHIIRLYNMSQTEEMYLSFINSPLGKLLF